MAKSDYPNNFSSRALLAIYISDKTCDISLRIHPKFCPTAKMLGAIE
jgi:hypothetical protein